MAEVFEAEVAGELGFVRKVAIKRMLADAAADPAAARRFLDEARIASRLHHANIVAVTDVGLLDGLPFQVLEFVDGINAQQLQQRAGGTLPLDIALLICADVAHALDHAHRATDAAGISLGFVHRDVKPSNVLVAWSGDVKLADFGIALARDRSARTETGIVAGTLGFIAPEQRTRSEVDGRADVFALGLTLHAFLTGYTPLRDFSAEMELLEGTPLPLDETLPADIRDLIARAVAPSRLERPTASEFAAALGTLLATRLTRDPRTTLRAFLDTLDTAPKHAGALDHLLGIEVVPAALSNTGVPEFKTVARREIRGGGSRDVVGDIGDRGSRDMGRDVGIGRDVGREVGRDMGRDARGEMGRDIGGDIGGDVGRGSRDVVGDIGDRGSRDVVGDIGDRGSRDMGRDMGGEIGRDIGGDIDGDVGREIGGGGGAMRGRISEGRRGGLFAIIALIVAVGGGIGVWRLTRSSSTAPDVVATTSRDAGSDINATVDAGATAGSDINAMADAGAIAASDVEAADAVDVASRTDARRDATRSGRQVAKQPRDADVPNATVETGYLQVLGGEELVGAQVIVDGGRWKFFVPHKHEIAVGSHRVEVIKPDGTRLPAKTVEVTAFHTLRNAARVRY